MTETTKRGGKAAIRAAVQGAQPAQAEAEWPPGFEMNSGGLWRTATREDAKPMLICGPFEVLAETRPETNDAWGLLLRWRDRDGNAHEWVMPRAMLAGEAAELRARLAAGGLFVSGGDGARKALVQALAGVKVATRGRTVPRIGWFHGPAGGAAFVLPGRACGVVPGERLILDMDPPPSVFRERGTLDAWQCELAALCVGNSRLAFCVSMAFAGALLSLTGDEGGGVHIRGDSSKGKTTALHVAASVWGTPSGPHAFVRQWRATGNGLEATAAAHNDCLLPLDEIGQAEPREIPEIAYMLANGQGKERMRDRGGLRRTATWRVLFLSTGEESLADMTARAGKVVKAGQEVRFLDVPADAGAGLGLFECIHDAASADDFAKRLRTGAMQQHGSAGPALLDRLAAMVSAEPAWPGEVLGRRLRDFTAQHMPAGADGQVSRALRRFALAAVAGELATELGITGWPPGEAERAAVACFRAWLLARGGTGSREAQQIGEALRRFIGLHGAARFETLREQEDDDAAQAEPPLADARTINRAGWKWQEVDASGARRWCYGFLPDVFAAELCRPLGMEAGEARRKLHALGLIRTEQRGAELRLTVRHRIPGHGRPALLVLLPGLLDDDEAAPLPAAAE